MNSLSGGYFVTGAQSLFGNRLLNLIATKAPNLNPGQVLATGATDIQRVFSGPDLTAVLTSYMAGIKDVFAWSMAGALFTAVLALVVPFKKMPDVENQKTAGQNPDKKDSGENLKEVTV